MHKQDKDAPKKGKAAARKAPRRAKPVRRDPRVEHAESAPVYAWRQEGDPPGVFHQGTAQELAERQRAGIRASGISVVAQHGQATRTYAKRATLLLAQSLKASGLLQGSTLKHFNLSARALPTRTVIISGLGARETRVVPDAAPRSAQQVEPAAESSAEPSAGPATAQSGAAPVAVPAGLLRAAREKTGIESDAELVAFALSLLVEPDPAAEFLREERGSLPSDFRLDF